MLPLLLPSFQVDQVIGADKVFVEDFKLLGDRATRIESVLILQNAGGRLPWKSSHQAEN